MRRLLLPVAFVALLLAVTAPGRADLATLVEDLAVREGPNLGSGPGEFVRVGSHVVFFAREPLGRYIVAATDGTPAGTAVLHVDERPSRAVGLVGGSYLWFGETASGSYSLWATGGTAATTRRLVSDGIYEPPYGSPLSDADGGRLYFLRNAAAPTYLELWASDGTAEGTGRVSSLGRIGYYPVALTVHRHEAFFQTAWIEFEGGQVFYSDWKLWRTRPAGGARLLGPSGDVTLHSTSRRVVYFLGGRLWSTDGTPAGTRPVAAPPGEPTFEVTWIGGTMGGRLYFGGRHPHHGDALWSTDGTARGTRLLARELTFDAAEPGLEALPVGGRLYFVANDGIHGRELWSTGGNPVSTGMVADVCPGSCSAFAGPFHGPQLVAAGIRTMFLADDGSHGRELWSSDGTIAGTLLVRDHCPGPCGVDTGLRPAGNDVFYYLPGGAGGIELWASDGTAGGTRRLTGFATFALPDGTLPDLSVARIGDRVVSLGWDRRGGLEPWVYDAAGGGGRPLADLATGFEAESANPFDAVALGDRLLFITGGGESGESAAAWSTRGTAETTVALGEVPPPRLAFEPPLIAVAGGRGYLNLGELWRTDGTASGTVRLTDFAATAPGSRVSTAIVDLDGRVAFGVTAGGGSQETELWVSDGTVAGTHPAGPAFPLRVFDLTAVGDDLYFWADDGENGWEICAVDSALGDVRLLTDRADSHEPGPLWVAPEFTRIGARVYFMVPDRWGGASLWRSDGSTAGTERVPPPVVGEFEQWRRTFAGLGGSVLLFTSSSNGFDLRLWSGAGSGTDWTQLRDFGAGSQLGEVVRRDDEVLFVVREGGGGGLGLYRTDGTAAGTREALDFAALGVDEVRSVHAVGARLFFAAGPQVGRTELWVSDGTPATTRRLQEIAPGESGSEPRGFALAGSHLYFSADDGLHGRELWSLPLDRLEAPCQPSATALCLGDGRFRAELFRHDRAGERGDGRAVPWSSASGAFWFYDYGNPEAAVKVVDGGAVNGRYWLFFGPLGDAYVALTVTDLETGEVRRYPAEPGPLAAFADLAAFPSATAAPAGEPASAEFASIAEGAFAELERAAEGPPSSIAAPAVSAGAAGACGPGSTRLCLQDGRFAVGLLWRDGSGVEHQAFAFAHGDRAGYFAFYGARDLQAALKILDGRAINGRFWLFATSLTHLGYTLTVTDSETGAVYDYPKPAGTFASMADLTSLR